MEDLVGTWDHTEEFQINIKNSSNKIPRAVPLASVSVMDSTSQIFEIGFWLEIRRANRSVQEFSSINEQRAPNEHFKISHHQILRNLLFKYKLNRVFDSQLFRKKLPFSKRYGKFGDYRFWHFNKYVQYWLNCPRIVLKINVNIKVNR